MQAMSRQSSNHVDDTPFTYWGNKTGISTCLTSRKKERKKSFFEIFGRLKRLLDTI